MLFLYSNSLFLKAKNRLQERKTAALGPHNSSALVVVLGGSSPAVEATEQTVVVANKVVCHGCQLLINHLTHGHVLISITLVCCQTSLPGTTLQKHVMSVRPAYVTIQPPQELPKPPS